MEGGSLVGNFAAHPLDPGDAAPLFISAGVLKTPAQLKPFLEIPDPDVVPALNIGNFSYHPSNGNAKPGALDFVYYQTSRRAGNNRGLPNSGREGVEELRDSVRQLSDRGITTIMSLVCLPSENPLIDLPAIAAIAAELQPTAIEINISCPNTKREDGLFHPPISNDVELSCQILEACREELGVDVCMGIKDSAHAESPKSGVNISEIATFAQNIAPYIDFTTGINSLENQPFPEFYDTGGRGGLSGPPIAEIANQHLVAWRQAAPEVAYLSTGGVDTVNASIEIKRRLLNGALRVGGAQEFYQAAQPHLLSARWITEFVAGY